MLLIDITFSTLTPFRTNCYRFVRTPLVDKQIPEQAKTLGISEEEVVKKVMLKDTVDGEVCLFVCLSFYVHFLRKNVFE